MIADQKYLLTPSIALVKLAEIARELVSGKMITWDYLVGVIIWSLLLGSLIYLIEKTIARTC